ncbi:MAG: gephyrin-like molybdotransferase Glp [Candidatus Competibacter sp.]
MSGCYFGDQLLTLAEAIDTALRSIQPIQETKMVSLLDAYGQVLAADLLARQDVPSYDNSAMDGFALYRADLGPGQPTRLPVMGQSLAGHPYSGVVPRGVVVRITTGAMLPAGPDAVVMQEDCRIASDESWIEVDGPLTARLKAGENIRRRGEDVRIGTVLLPRGLRLRPQDVSLAAGQGIAVLEVVRQPRVAVASTGDELCVPEKELSSGQIYESNRYTLIGLLQRLGCSVTDLGILRDDREAVLPALQEAAATHDVLLTSGGVSVGTMDLVKDVIAELGRIEFWRLAVKPGKPITFGWIDNCLILGLPGNPVSVAVAFLIFARPLLLRLMGAESAEPLRLRAQADFQFRRKPGRREWLRARLRYDPKQNLVASIYHTNSSGVLSSLSWAEGLVELPEDCAGVVPGDMVDYLPFVGMGME